MKIRYSIRFILFLTAVVGILLSLWVNRAIRQRDAVANILAVDGWVYYGNKSVPMTIDESTLSLHLFQSVTLVTLRPTAKNPADNQLELVAELPALKQLTIWPGQAGNTLDLRALGGITDRGVETIVNHMPHIQHLGVTAGVCSDGALRRLEKGLPSAKLIHVKMRDASRQDLLVQRP